MSRHSLQRQRSSRSRRTTGSVLPSGRQAPARPAPAQTAHQPARPHAAPPHHAGASRRRRRRWSSSVIAWTAGGVALAVVLAVVLIGVTGGSPAKHPPARAGTVALPAALVKQVTSVPASVLDEVGIAGQAISSRATANPVNVVSGSSASIPTVGGKPAFFYLSAEWCPYCALERWSLVVALSRFGTFTGLAGVASSPSDFAPDTQTLTFAGARFSSPYIAFEPVEVQSATGAALDHPTAAEQRVLAVWDPRISFPFFDVAGRYVGGVPAWLSPTILQGLTRSQIAALLDEPASSTGRLIDANANYVTAAVCAVDGGRPGSVCSSAGVLAAAAQLRNAPEAVPVS